MHTGKSGEVVEPMDCVRSGKTEGVLYLELDTILKNIVVLYTQDGGSSTISFPIRVSVVFNLLVYQLICSFAKECIQCLWAMCRSISRICGWHDERK